MSLVVKTGMQTELSIAKKYAASGTLVLTGEFTPATLDIAVPLDCTALISLGVCGGLAPEAQIGQAFIYDAVVTPDGTLTADVSWRKRIFAATKYYERHCWSSGQFNTANTIAQRADLYAKTNCAIIDDETYAVAMVAQKRGIPWIGLRTVSDGAEDNLPPACLDALNPDGSDNFWEVAKSVFTEPIDPTTDNPQVVELLRTYLEAKKSFDELETACLQVGPHFCWA